MFSNGLSTLFFAFLAGQQQQQQQQQQLRDPMMSFCPGRHSMSTAFVSYHNHQRSLPSSAEVNLHQQRQRGGRVTPFNQAIAINKKIVNLGRNKQWKEILKLYQQEKDNFNEVNYATVMSQLGRIHSFDRRQLVFLHFLDDLAEKMEQRGLQWIRARESSNIIHAIGKMKLSNKTGKQIMQWMSKSENVQELLAERVPQSISNTAWAFARLDYDAPNLFAEIDSHAEWLVKEGNSQDVANTAWACATVGFDAPNLFAEIDRQAKWLVKEENAQSIANTAWAFAKLGFNALNLFAKIDRHAEWLVKEGNSQDVANTAWACATVGFDAPNLFAEIDHNAEWLVKEGNPQDVANTAWACATLGYDSTNLFAEIDHNSEWLVKEGKPQAIANTAWACATLGYDSTNLLAEIDRRAEWLVREGTPQNVANTAWACATLGFDAPNLFAEIDAVKDELLVKFTAQNLANTCFAIVVSGCNKIFEGLLLRLWDMAGQPSFSDNFSDINLRQLAQVQLFAVADGTKLSELPEILSIRMDLAMQEKENTISKSQEEVSNVLHELGFSWDLEVAPVPNMCLGMLAIDVACKDQMIAVEFDGPSHYLKEVGTGNISLTETGTTKAKRRFLEKLGWSVINIDYRDWMRVKRVGSEKQWLQAKLLQARACGQTKSASERIEEERRWENVDVELAEGKAVRVSGGDYQGMIGVVVRTTKHKVVVLIEGSEKERMLAKRNVEAIEWSI